MAECSALILAGGGSHRMGDAKALLDRLGEPQINYLCRTVAAHCSALWVSSGAEPKLPVGLAGRWILDGQLEGPLRALYSAIDRIETPLLHLLAVDFPRWSPANLDALCAGLGAHDAAVPRRNGQRV
ncbi:MAG: NTP transferase domain-containing protein, partial [Myxococcota bacterium]